MTGGHAKKRTTMQGGNVPWIWQCLLRDWGSGGILPAFVVGHEIDHAARPTPALYAPRTYAQVSLAFDYNGLAMVPFALTGYYLPLHWNRSKSLAPERSGPETHDVDSLLASLRAHAQSASRGGDCPDPGPPLPYHCGFAKSDMKEDDLTTCASIIGRSYVVPRPKRGFEALVDFGVVDSSWIIDWKAFVFSTDQGGWARPTGLKTLERSDAFALGKARLWLVWENCD